MGDLKTLVLGQRTGDRIRIRGTGECVMTVVWVKDGTVRLAFQAPESVEITREGRNGVEFHVPHVAGYA